MVMLRGETDGGGTNEALAGRNGQRRCGKRGRIHWAEQDVYWRRDGRRLKERFVAFGVKGMKWIEPGGLLKCDSGIHREEESTVGAGMQTVSVKAAERMAKAH